MATSDLSTDEMMPVQPLIEHSSPIEAAADTMLAASRTMLAASAALSSGVGLASAREREFITDAIEIGFLRALRRDTLLGGAEVSGAGASLLGLPSRRGIPGTGYGRMGASVTGEGARAQLYGTIGGAIGYAVGGPVGAILGGMLGGLFGGDDDDEERARQQDELRRQWLNTPEGFEIQAYLYNLARGYQATGSLIPALQGGGTSGTPFFKWTTNLPSNPPQPTPVMVHMSPGAVQITGQSEEGGERAARAFAGALGRVLRLNSVVVPAAGLGGDV